MFCGECGAKNKKGSQFCENCGTKIEVEKEIPIREKKPMTKKNKIILGIVSFAVVVIIGISICLENLTNPKNIAEQFFQATINFDFDAIYEYLNVDNSEFTSKEMFNKVMSKGVDVEDKPIILNYTVGKPVLSSDQMSATITITYMLQDEDESDTLDVKLIKAKNKKWLFFDNWKVSTKGISIAKNYEVKVLKGTSVFIEGIELSSNYLSSEKSTGDYDIYVIPSIFEAEYEVAMTLPMGIQVNDIMYVNDDYSYTYRLSLNDLTLEVKDNLKTIAKTSLQTLYDAVKEQKNFDDIQSNFEYENGDLTTLRKDYENLVSSIGTSTTLTAITFKDISLSSLDLTVDGKLELYLKATYDYSVSYQSGDEVKTHDSSDYDYVYLTFDYENGNYHLIDTSSLNTYFSKYY